MSERYYQANKSGTELIRDYFAQREKAWKAAEKLARKLAGKKAKALCVASLDKFEMVGVRFPSTKHANGTTVVDDWDAKVWKQSKNRYSTIADLEPRAGTKAGKEVIKQMADIPAVEAAPLRDHFGLPAKMKFIGMSLFRGDFGMTVGSDGKGYLMLADYDDREPKNARRVSDMTFEKHTATPTEPTP